MVDWFIPGIVFSLSFLLTGLARRYSVARQLMDIPNSRSSHDVPTPRGGGIAIVFCFIGALLYYYNTGYVKDSAFNSLFVGGLLIAGIGYWDDHRHISAKWRLLVHFSVAFWVFSLFGGSQGLQFGGDVVGAAKIGNLFGAVALVWLLNLYNFMDGIDGFAGAETISVLLCIVFILLVNGKLHESFLLIALVAACLGFLIWNWPPAKIFMGDVGSGFLGFVLGVFALYMASEGILSLWCWVILLAVFLVDSTVTLLSRIARGERFYEAHRSHAYQHLSIKLQKRNGLKGMSPIAARARGHSFVALCCVGINIFWLFPLALFVSMRPESRIYLTCVSMAPLVVIALKLGAGKKL